jgi:hypothetical protein
MRHTTGSAATGGKGGREHAQQPVPSQPSRELELELEGPPGQDRKQLAQHCTLAFLARDIRHQAALLVR